MLYFIRTSDHDLPLPARGSDMSAGLDLPSNTDVTITPGGRYAIGTGWSVDMVALGNVYGRVAPRSGKAYTHGAQVLAGVIDADYQGEIKVILLNTGDVDLVIRKGDRIAQLIIEQMVLIDPEEADQQGNVTDRGEDGFGSTGL